jgi:hypothetical protein
MQHASAADSVWHTPDGKPIPDSDSRKGANGFGASVVVTPDEEWQAKWNTPHDMVPRFTTTSAVKVGGKATILIFLVNPKLNAQREVDIRCDLRILRPDGSASIDEKNVVCLGGRLQGDPRSVRLAAPVITFVGEPQDPLGEWRIEISVKDALRDTTLPLTASFSLQR